MGVRVKERNGAWWVYVDWKGRRKAKRVGTGKAAKRAAEAAAEKLQAQLTLGNTAILDSTRGRALTFGEHADRWLQSYVAVHLKASSQEMYGTVLAKHWKPALGNLPLASLTREHVKTQLGRLLASGLSATRVKSVLNVLQACLSAAVEDNVIPGNPAPKSNRSRRVDMSRQLCQVIQGHLTLREAEAVVRGSSAPPWLFPDSEGQPLTPGAFWRTVWRPLLKRAEVRYRKPHALRHTFASLLIQNRESLAYVRDQMRHHSIKITVDIYGHLVPGANKAAVDRLDEEPARNLYATRHVSMVPAIYGGEA